MRPGAFNSMSNTTFLLPEIVAANQGVNRGSKGENCGLSPPGSLFSTGDPNPLFKFADALYFAHSLPGNDRRTPDKVATNWNLGIPPNSIQIHSPKEVKR